MPYPSVLATVYKNLGLDPHAMVYDVTEPPEPDPAGRRDADREGVLSMMRPTLLLLMASPIALAAPVPAPTEKEQIAKLWGKTIAPSDDYEFKLNGKALTIRTAGVPVRGLIEGANFKAPRTTRTVTGDFEMTVKVAAAAAPRATRSTRTRGRRRAPASSCLVAATASSGTSRSTT